MSVRPSAVGGKRPEPADRASGRACAARPRAGHAVEGAPEVPRRAGSRTSRRCCSTSARSSAPTSRSSASSSAASCSSRICSPTSTATRGRHARGAAGADRARFRRPTPASTAILCWDIFDFLDRARGRGARPADRPRAPARRRGDGLLLHLAASSAAPFTKYEIVDETHRCGTGLIPAPAARSTRCQNRDIIKMFDGLFVSESFLLKSNTREILLRKQELGLACARSSRC